MTLKINDSIIIYYMQAVKKCDVDMLRTLFHLECSEAVSSDLTNRFEVYNYSRLTVLQLVQKFLLH
jgi:hypothetical protein